ncbi:MAG: hypothetical protein HKN17_08240 [Rhodothermales bacterium]|nr:hypothetical protein [Rhodothermales bacterium]
MDSSLRQIRSVLRVRQSPVRLLSVLLLCSVSFTAGCSGRTGASDAPSSSGEPVSDSLMIELLAALHTADAERYLGAMDPDGALSGDSSQAAAIDSVLRLRGSALDSVLAVHGLSRTEYDATVGGLVDDPDRFVNLYNRVLDRLNQVR